MRTEKHAYMIKGAAGLEELAPKLEGKSALEQMQIIKVQLKRAEDYEELLKQKLRNVNFAMRRMRVKYSQLRRENEL